MCAGSKRHPGWLKGFWCESLQSQEPVMMVHFTLSFISPFTSSLINGVRGEVGRVKGEGEGGKVEWSEGERGQKRSSEGGEGGERGKV